MTYSSDLVARLAARGLTQDNADEQALAVAASIVAVAGMRPIPGLSVTVTDPEVMLRFLTQVVEVATSKAAVLA